MAKANRSLGEKPTNEQTEEIIDTTATAQAKEAARHDTNPKQEIDLKYGQCIVVPVDKPEEEIVTTLDDWHSLYNAGANQGRFVLRSEKKS
jgi:hypothetical protein